VLPADTTAVLADRPTRSPTRPTRSPTRRRARRPARARDPAAVRAAALAAGGLRVLVSLDDRRLFVLDGPDTLRVAPVGIGMDSTIVFEGRVWRFQTPRGVRRVRRKDANPVWVPPEWHYVEVARARGLRVARLPAEGGVAVDDTTEVVVEDGEIGLARDTLFTPFAPDQEVIWEGTLYIPPVGTPQRQVPGELGRYRLDLGDGYLLHGTPHAESVGMASSHGCMRLGDDDIAWLYRRVPVGTRVYTY
jgi:lipoprotein-anchoring transpeptidase ErfK/SrfK